MNNDIYAFKRTSSQKLFIMIIITKALCDS